MCVLSIAACGDVAQVVRYKISLTDPARHLLTVRVEIPPGGSTTTLELPAWYALYQIRDFSQYVNWVKVDGRGTSVRKIDKSRWVVDGAENGTRIQYQVFANSPGPFGAVVDSSHAFFNLAEILMYSSETRGLPVEITFTDVPANWRIGTVLKGASTSFSAANYDDLIDSPVELSAFNESDFDIAGGHYRVIVDGPTGDYEMAKLGTMLRKIVTAEVNWMADRPFSTYLFIYHFPHKPGGGGMEHAYSTAIDVDTQTLTSDPHTLERISAHEFFHLWNVKRIRPRALEVPDYSKENFTDALWFSEGVTSTIEDYITLRAGLTDEKEYLARLGQAIGELQSRPAHSTQSVEESGIDAWLEGYSFYRSPERSVSYYNKGALLGVLLDLQMREASNNRASVQDLFQYMNVNYAQKNKSFSDSEGVRAAAEVVSKTDLSEFFERYVKGTDEIPWNYFFGTVGLKLRSAQVEYADTSFVAERNFDSPWTVTSVDPDSAAQAAGLRVGDVILEINGQLTDDDYKKIIRGMHPGETIEVKIQNGEGKRTTKWVLGSSIKSVFSLEDSPSMTASQKTRRESWLGIGSEGPARQK